MVGKKLQSVQDLVELGGIAFEEYDYEETENCYREAFVLSKGGVQAALPLLELLVDYLAAYDGAVQLFSKLSKKSLADSQVRTLVALAAARTAKQDIALQMVQGVKNPRLFDVYLALAKHAIKDKRDQDASTFLERSRDFGSPNNEVLRLEDELASLRTILQTQLEDELKQLASSAGRDEIESQANELLERFPSSGYARKVLSDLQKQKRGIEGMLLVERAKTALEREAYTMAKNLFRQALSLGGSKEEIGPLLEVAEQKDQEKQDLVLVEEVLEFFQNSYEKKALRAYLKLDEKLRMSVRQKVGLELLGWAEDLMMISKTASEDLILGLLAYQTALSQKSDDPEKSYKLLKAYKHILEGLDGFDELIEEARLGFRETRINQTLNHIEQARACLDNASFDDALKHIGSIDHSLLDVDKVEQVDKLLVAVQRARETHILQSHYERCLVHNDLLSARRAARELREQGSEQDKLDWKDKLNELSDHIQQKWRLSVFKEEDCKSSSELLNFSFQGGYREGYILKLQPAGPDSETTGKAKMLIVTPLDDWVFVRTFLPESGSLETCVVFRTPLPFGKLYVTTADEHALWLVGQGGILKLDRQNWDILNWDSFKDLIPPNCSVVSAHLTMDSSFLWVNVKTNTSERSILIVDIERKVTVRTLTGFQGALPIIGGEGPLYLGVRKKSSKLFDTRGTGVWDDRFRPAEARSAAIHPDGKGIVVLHPNSGKEDPDCLAVTSYFPNGKQTDQLVLKNTHSKYECVITTSMKEGLSFILCLDDDLKKILLAIGHDDTGSTEIYRCRVSNRCSLISDLDSKKVALVTADGEGVETVLLGDKAPGVRSEALHIGREIPRFRTPILCLNQVMANNLSVNTFCTTILELPRFEVKKWVRKSRDFYKSMPEKLVQLYYSLRLTRNFDLAKELATWSAKLELSHSGISLIYGETLCEDERWKEALRILENLNVRDFDTHQAEHFQHLKGFVLFKSGQRKRAFRAWKASQRQGSGICNMEPYINLAKPLSDPLRAEDWDEKAPLVRRVMGAIKTANVSLYHKNPEIAVIVVGTPLFWYLREYQSLARLARAWMMLTPSRASEKLQKLIALAAFRMVHSVKNPEDRLDIPVPGCTLTQDEADELYEQAGAWLDQFGRNSE